MQRLPHYDRAIVQREKLYDYVLNPDHPLGKHKARVFKSLLAIERGNAEVLADVIKGSLFRAAAIQGASNQYGESWKTYHDILGVNGKSAIVTVSWIFATTEPEVPRFVTCFIEPDAQDRLALLLQSG